MVFLSDMFATYDVPIDETMSIADFVKECKAADELMEMAVKGRYEFLPVKSVFELLKNPKQPGVIKNEVIRFQNDAINTASKSERFDDLQREFNVGEPGLDCGFGNDVYQPVVPKNSQNGEISVWENHCREDEEVYDPFLLISRCVSFTPWHIDGDPPLTAWSQLQRGEKLWFFTTNRRVTNFLLRKPESRWSPSSWLTESLRMDRKDLWVHVQKPGNDITE